MAEHPSTIAAEGEHVMDDAKLAELRLIHKDLAAYLKEQHEAMSNSILAVAAIRGALANNPTLQKSYRASLQDLTNDGTTQPALIFEQVLLRLLKRLEEW